MAQLWYLFKSQLSVYPLCRRLWTVRVTAALTESAGSPLLWPAIVAGAALLLRHTAWSRRYLSACSPPLVPPTSAQSQATLSIDSSQQLAVCAVRSRCLVQLLTVRCRATLS